MPTSRGGESVLHRVAHLAARIQARGEARVAWSLFGLVASLTASSVTLIALAGSIPRELGPREVEIFDNLSFLLIPLVGALIASRRPENLLGWGLLGATLVGAVGELAGWYALHALVIDPGSLPGGGAASWFSQVAWVVPIGLLPLLFLMFPDGRLPSRSWRWVVPAVTLPVVLIAGPVAFALWPERGRVLLLESDSITVSGATETMFVTALAMMLLFALVGALSLFLRFRRSDGIQRQQIKWLAFAGLVLCAEGVLSTLVFPNASFMGILDTLAFATIPLAIGIAILRYRLYDIDRIINRTLVYGALSAVLGAVYALCVVVLPSVLGQDLRESDVVVAASTLLIAALFRPVRERIQGFIDRRFYRSRYDARKTVDDFGSSLRDAVDLDAISRDLVRVVRDTLQPSHASLWLRREADR